MSIVRSEVNRPLAQLCRPERPPEKRATRPDDRADRAMAARRRENVADAGKSAAFAAYFLGGGRYL